MIDLAKQPAYGADDIDRAAAFWGDETLGDWLRRRAEDMSGRPAIVGPACVMSYSEAYHQALRLADAYRGLGLAKGDVIAIQLPNVPEFVLCYFAIALMGGVVSMLHMPYRAGEMAPLLVHGGAKAIVCGAATAAYDAPATMLDLRDRVPSLEIVIVAGDAAPDGTVSLAALLERGAPRDIADPPRAADPLVFAFTSGTSAAPKAILRDHRSMLANQREVAPWFGLGPDDRVLSAPPFTHIFGLCAANLILHVGAANVLMPQFSPEGFCETIERQRITMLFCTPAHIAACLQAGLHEIHDLSSLRVAYVAASKLAYELARAWDAAMPNGAISQMFGMTETIMSMAIPFDDPLETRLRFIGRVTPGIEMRITAEDETVLAPGNEGELEIRGYSVFPGYYGNDAANRDAFRAGGWFRTGDLGSIDEDGHLMLSGRVKDIVNRGGIKINPSDIEALIDTHPAVAQCAIAPLPDDVLGERACLFVSLHPGQTLTLEDVTDYLATRNVAKLRWPERLEIVDDMPLTPTRKIIKGELVRRLGEHRTE